MYVPDHHHHHQFPGVEKQRKGLAMGLTVLLLSRVATSHVPRREDGCGVGEAGLGLVNTTPVLD